MSLNGQAIKADASRHIVDIISSYVPLQKKGKVWMGMCPFHADTHTASFVVWDGDSQSPGWRCFGACATGGDIIDFIMRAEKLEFKEALQFLIERHHIRNDDRRVVLLPKPPREKAKPPPIAVQTAMLRWVNWASVNLFSDNDFAKLMLTILHAWGLRDETIRAFKLGCVTPMGKHKYGFRIPAEKWGLAKDARGVWLPVGITFPALARSGLPLYLKVRKYKHTGELDTPKYLFVGPHSKGAFGLHLHQPLQRLWYVESEANVPLAWQAVGGQVNVLSLGSAANTTIPDFVRAEIAQHKLTLVTLDNDEAGRRHIVTLCNGSGLPGYHNYEARIPEPHHDLRRFYQAEKENIVTWFNRELYHAQQDMRKESHVHN